MDTLNDTDLAYITATEYDKAMHARQQKYDRCSTCIHTISSNMHAHEMAMSACKGRKGGPKENRKKAKANHVQSRTEYHQPIVVCVAHINVARANPVARGWAHPRRGNELYCYQANESFWFSSTHG